MKRISLFLAGAFVILSLSACEYLGPMFGGQSDMGGTVGRVVNSVGKARFVQACADTKVKMIEFDQSVDPSPLSEEDLDNWEAAARTATNDCVSGRQDNYIDRAIAVEQNNDVMAEINAKGIAQ